MTNNNLENYEKHCNVGTVNSVTDLLTYIDSDTLYTGEIGNGENDKISFIMTIVNNIRFILTSDGTLCKYNDLTSTKAVTFSYSSYFSIPQFYGAVGDGVNDDTDALQKAIKENKAVYIPAGIYKVGKLTIEKPNLKIFGAGINKTIIKHNDDKDSETNEYKYKNDDCIIHITGSSNCTLSSFSVKGKISEDDYKYHGIKISNSNSSDNTIENINVSNCPLSGIKLETTCIGCHLSNIRTYENGECGLYNGGYGNKIVNLDTHQNRKHGIKINIGGFNGTNIKSWGNRGDGVNMDNTLSNASCINLSNVSVQQNGRHGLMMTNCKSCVITGFQSLANNFISGSRLKNGEKPLNNAAGILLTDNNHNNYIQGNITSCYDYWNSFEESSIRIAGKNNINNIIDVSVCDSLKGPDMYNVCFLPYVYTYTDKNKENKEDKFFNYTNLNEYNTLKQKYDNPLNIIKINGETVTDKSMTDIKMISPVINSYMKNSDGLNYLTVTDNLSENPDILKLNLNDYSELPTYTVDDLKGINNIDFAKVAYRRGYKINLKNNTNEVLYLKLTAKVSEYKAFGIFPTVQVSYKNEAGKLVYKYLDSSLDYGKTNIIFNTSYITKNIAFDISKYKDKDITVYPLLCITKLSATNISGNAIQDTAAIDIKEFSYKLC